MSVEVFLASAIGHLNGVLWNYMLIALLLGAGAWFTWRFAGIQLRALPLSVQTLFRDDGEGKRKGDGISSFQAFATGLASRVGTGNIVGVAVALSAGGPGAIFWMWLTALLGMALAFVEATLAQIFKVSHHDNTFRGGPAYYIWVGLRSRRLGMVFAASLILAFGLVFNAVQANSVADALHASFGTDRVVTGALLIVLIAPVIFGGIRRIARIAQFLVPVMAFGYLALAGYVLLAHLSSFPAVIALIVRSAFGLEQAVGGVAGYAISQIVAVGIKRGLFSNEAGMGSAPNAAATATTRHPVTQGLIQMLGVFVDTILICSATALIILLSGEYQPGAPVEGAVLTQRAMSSHVGDWGATFLTCAIFMLAFSSIMGNYACAEGNVMFITRRKDVLVGFRCAVLGMVMFGSVAKLPLIWSMADLSMGLMATINLLAVLALGKYARAAWLDYCAQRNAGIAQPVFNRHTITGLDAILPEGAWSGDAYRPSTARQSIGAQSVSKGVRSRSVPAWATDSK
ncbi:alanine:cation symporter family protein (plasmid) [Mycetohabitans endofungorum]